MLLDEIVRWLLGTDVQTFELLGGEEEYKADWADGYRDVLLLQAFAHSVPGFVDGFVSVEGRRAAIAARRLVRKLRS